MLALGGLLLGLRLGAIAIALALLLGALALLLGVAVIVGGGLLLLIPLLGGELTGHNLCVVLSVFAKISNPF